MDHLYLMREVTVSPTIQPAEHAVLVALAKRNPKATQEQLQDEIYNVGVLHLMNTMNLKVEDDANL